MALMAEGFQDSPDGFPGGFASGFSGGFAGGQPGKPSDRQAERFPGGFPGGFSSGFHGAIAVDELIGRIVDNIQNVIVGKRSTIEYVVIALVCGGHVLIEDVPGVGKTSLVSALSKSISCTFSRIQFTPDVLPTDVTGFSMYNMKTTEFEYRAGAVMSQIVLADEINRTSPKTQSSLLEAMQEGQVTVDGFSHALPQPFMVLATQNPIEYLGTFPLPEAQLDRFLMKVRLGYPEPDDEAFMLSRFSAGTPLDALSAVSSPDEIIAAKDAVMQTYVDPAVSRYIVGIVQGTRSHPDIALGVSPRGSIALYRAAQAWACYNGRDFCTPDDVKGMALPVLSHRIKLRQDARLKSLKSESVVSEIVSNAFVPAMGKSAARQGRSADL
jgi:MoxR-like ATPase